MNYASLTTIVGGQYRAEKAREPALSGTSMSSCATAKISSPVTATRPLDFAWLLEKTRFGKRHAALLVEGGGE